DQRHGSGPERCRGGGAADLAVAAGEEDAEACERVAVGGDVGHLPLAPARGLRFLFLVVRQGVEDARASSATALVDRAAPRVLLEVHALLRLEHARAADGGNRGQGGRKAPGRIL